MAANKFATMLHRNTNRITLILVYAILEWVLILLLFWNSLFSFLIVKYAEYFGLRRPCLWCARLDHIFDSTKKKNSYRDLVCDDHATEISKLGFCSNHLRFSESQDMCEDCSSSSQHYRELSKNYAFFPWMRQIGMIQGSGEVAAENGEVDSKCSCCGVSLEKEKRKLYSPYVLIQPSWEVLDYTQKGNLIKEAGVDCEIDDGDHSDHSKSSEFVCSQVENCSFSISNSDCKEMLPNEDEKVEGSVTEEEEEPVREDDLNASMDDDQACDQNQIQASCGKDLGLEIAPKHIEFYIEGEDFHLIPVETMDPSKAESRSEYKFGEEEQGNCGNEDIILDFNESEWSSFIQAQSEEKSNEKEHEQTPSTDEDVQEISETVRVDMESEENQVSSELIEIEEENVPDTPTSIDSLHQLHKKFLLLERRECGTEESVDGGSDIDGGGDGTSTVEKLKSALRVKRKALNALYAELEEERSASAVAANQTMAMINRLQEEKAAMQMEALQYQRMMEEQSEYDQEAMQLLNDLMVKREKEKAEIEKELEIYQKKVQDYEAKEKMMMSKRRRRSSRTSSVSCSNGEDSDGISIEDSFKNHEESIDQNSPPADAVLYLDESLANFEQERLLILEQLKGLEEKLFTLNDVENGNGFNENHDYKAIGTKAAKSLLPLFDAEFELEFDSAASQNSSVAKSELDSKRVAFEEEVDNVYDRLQALEADREFLRHCISSLRKGDKGLYILQEILQHLRDLRDVELRAKNSGDFAS